MVKLTEDTISWMVRKIDEGDFHLQCLGSESSLHSCVRTANERPSTTGEALKHQLKAATELTEAKMRRANVVISGTIDMMMGAVEKDSPRAKIFQRLRSKMRQRGDQTDAEPLPVPVREATQ